MLDLTLVGLGVTLEPLPISIMILLLSTTGGRRKATAFLAGWVASLVVVVTGTVLAAGSLPASSRSTSTAALVVKLLLGMALIGVGVSRWRRLGAPRSPSRWSVGRLDSLSLVACAGLGAFLQPWALVAAGAATIIQANLSPGAAAGAIAYFALLCCASLLAIRVYAAVAWETAQVRLAVMNAWLDSHQDVLVVALALLLGAWLSAHSTYLLITQSS